LTEGKLGNTFVPTFDDFADADLGNERNLPISAGIELLSIGKSSNIVNRDGIAAFRVRQPIARCNRFDGELLKIN